MKNLISVFILTTLLGCTEKENVDNKTVIQSDDHAFTVDTVSTTLENPWGIAFLPDGRILVTEREGRIVQFKDGKQLAEEIQNVPAVFANGQGGLLDIKLHPDYESNGWIYLTYSKPGQGGGGTTLSRTKLDGNAFVEFQELFSAQPFTNSGSHFGSRIAFDGKGYIFFSSGERGEMQNAQNLGNHLGKILRLHDDGRVPNDNPFVNKTGAKPEIWSYGNRNPQGVVYDDATGTLWAHEHGPKGGDELNRIEKGKNYGWPSITYGINYDGNPITDKTEQEGMEQPVTYWVPSIAPCGMAILKGDKFPGWKSNLLIGALAFRHVARVVIEDGKYVKQEKLLDQVARVRAVEESPEGFIYVATEGPGMLLKLSPAVKEPGR
ncbi:MAG TPA: PQQ-dependent sugar dehydrogenase [Chryseosolibacter sp.]|nr:PQQ-dependent sugar dehydrogenase [Chryseosolibacter sp.]